MLWYFQIGTDKEEFMYNAQEDGVNGKVVWKEIMKHRPNLEVTQSGKVRFKREAWTYGIPNFNWRQKLSPAGQELYKPIGSGKYKEPELRQLAREKGIDFDTAVTELKSHDGLYHVDPFGFVGFELRIIEE